MKTGTIIMIMCLGALVLIRLIFKSPIRRDEDSSLQDESVNRGLDGISGVPGMMTKDFDLQYDEDKR